MRPTPSPRLATVFSTHSGVNPSLPRPLWEALMPAPNNTLS